MYNERRCRFVEVDLRACATRVRAGIIELHVDDFENVRIGGILDEPADICQQLPILVPVRRQCQRRISSGHASKDRIRASTRLQILRSRLYARLLLDTQSRTTRDRAELVRRVADVHAVVGSGNGANGEIAVFGDRISRRKEPSLARVGRPRRKRVFYSVSLLRTDRNARSCNRSSHIRMFRYDMNR